MSPEDLSNDNQESDPGIAHFKRGSDYIEVQASVQDALSEGMPCSLPDAGYDMETLGRLASRGLLVEGRSTINSPDDTKQDHTYFYVLPGSPADALFEQSDLVQDSRPLKLYFQEAKTEEDDDRFKARWIHLY